MRTRVVRFGAGGRYRRQHAVERERDLCMQSARAAHEQHFDALLNRCDDELAAAWLSVRTAYVRRARGINRQLVARARRRRLELAP